MEALLIDEADVKASLVPWLAFESDSWHVEPSAPPLGCLSSAPTTSSVVDVYIAKDRTRGSVDGVRERIYSLPTEADAVAAMARYRAELGECANDHDGIRLGYTWEYDHLGEAAFQSWMMLPEVRDDAGGGAAHYVFVGAVRSGSRLAVVALDYYEHEWPGATWRLVETVARKLCGDECVGDIVQRQTYPQYQLADDPFLRDETFEGLGVDDSVYTLEKDAHGYEDVCAPGTGTGIDGAVDIRRAAWRSEDGEDRLDQLIIEFSDDQAAADFVARFTESPGECAVDVYDLQYADVTHLALPADLTPHADYVQTWTVEPVEEPAFASAGIGRCANLVVMVGFTSPADLATGSERDLAGYTSHMVVNGLGIAATGRPHRPGGYNPVVSR